MSDFFDETGVNSLTTIDSSGDGSETLYIADDCNHTQWIHRDVVEDSKAPLGRAPDCETCAEAATWRRVWVKA